MPSPPSLSIIVPTLNAAATLDTCLTALAEYKPAQAVIVVDGGSSDDTVQIAKQHGATVMTAPRGRGSQLAVGANAAIGNWLLFLHADTQLMPGWVSEIGAFIADKRNSHTAAVFTLALDDERLSARWVEWISATRTKILALPYGDQGLLISRELYNSVGGFKPIAIMEDVDIARRLGRKRIQPAFPG